MWLVGKFLRVPKSADRFVEHYEFVYREARRALNEQAIELNGLRDRTGLLLAAATVATSLLGQPTLADGVLGRAGTGAILLFLAFVIACMVVLLPVKDWYSAFGIERMLSTYVECDQPVTYGDFQRDLALHASGGKATNRRKLVRRYWEFIVAILLLCVQIGAWVWELRFPNQW